MSHDEITSNGPAGHEPNTVDARGIWRTAGLLVVLSVVACVVNGLLMQMFRSSGGNAPETITAPPQPSTLAIGAPPLDAEQAATLARVRAEEQQWLHEYAWVDEQSGQARIPVERAIAIASEQGLPASIGANSAAGESAR
jgi:hypothetical protein